jgi:hypothetical protein
VETGLAGFRQDRGWTEILTVFFDGKMLIEIYVYVQWDGK